MDFAPHQDVNNNTIAAGEQMGNIVDILGEAENILLGLKTLDATDHAGILAMPFRFGRPILEPLDSSLEPTPLRKFGGCVTPWTPAVVNTPVSPTWSVIANVSPSHQKHIPTSPGEVHSNNKQGSNTPLPFTSLDDIPWSLEDIDDFMEPQSPAVASSPSSASLMSVSTESYNNVPTQTKKRRIRKYKEDQWNNRYQELLVFRNYEGHVMVPHSYPRNQKLAQWVKR